jgi:hypothetical protein
MPFEDIFRLLLICSVIVLPALTLTLRFALKPIVDAMLRLREAGVLAGDRAEIHHVVEELQHLRGEVAEMKSELARVGEAQRFQLALGAGAAPAAPAPLPPEGLP